MSFDKSFLATGLVLSLTTFNAEATLTSYTSGGESLVYSSVSNITWTADANLLRSMIASNPNLVNIIIGTIGSIHDTPNMYDGSWNDYDGQKGRPYSGIHTLSTFDFTPGATYTETGEIFYDSSLGIVNWFGAQAFVRYLNVIEYAGSHQWSLPTSGANPQFAYNQISTQFGQLFYNELDGTARNPIPNAASFSNVQVGFPYWLATEDESMLPSYGWGFSTIDGGQEAYEKIIPLAVWAVSPGQVSAVPVPSVVWLFASGLGLLSIKARQKF